MMTTRAGRKPKAKTDNRLVTVEVVEPHAVYHDGEQRTGTVENVPADTARHWIRHGWATINHDDVPDDN
jgi:hypothetical protein